MEFNHIPVLLDECLEGLNIRPDGIYCDGTAGGAGHSREIAKRLDGEKGGRLVAIDRDPEAVKTATEHFLFRSCIHKRYLLGLSFELGQNRIRPLQQFFWQTSDLGHVNPIGLICWARFNLVQEGNLTISLQGRNMDIFQTGQGL